MSAVSLLGPLAYTSGTKTFEYTTKPHEPEFDARIPHGGKEEPALSGFPLISKSHTEKLKMSNVLINLGGLTETQPICLGKDNNRLVTAGQQRSKLKRHPHPHFS